jgi:hypothetical protein
MLTCVSALTQTVDGIRALIVDLRTVRDHLERGTVDRTLLTNLISALALWGVALLELDEIAPSVGFVVLAGEPAPSSDLTLSRGQVRAVAAIVIADMVLDAFAWTELSRRNRMPTVGAGHLPSPWRELGKVLGPDDAMRSHYAVLDVTLTAARDGLIAHPDPLVFGVPSFGGDGDVTLSVTSGETARYQSAAKELQKVLGRVPGPLRPHDRLLEIDVPNDDSAMNIYWHLLNSALIAARALDSDQRKRVNIAQQTAGFEAPPMRDMAANALSLLRTYVTLVNQA